jgi:hypothetical protein
MNISAPDFGSGFDMTSPKRRDFPARAFFQCKAERREFRPST